MVEPQALVVRQRCVQAKYRRVEEVISHKQCKYNLRVGTSIDTHF